MAPDSRQVSSDADPLKNVNAGDIKVFAATGDDVSVAKWDSSPTSPSRSRKVLPPQLNRNRPQSERNVTVRGVIDDLESYSTEEVGSILEAGSDMINEDADLDARKVYLLLLQACAIRPELSQLLPSIFDMTIKTIHPSLLYSQISTLDQLTDHGQQLGLAPGLVEFLTKHLDTIFDAGEQARLKRRDVNLANSKDTHARSQRPEEEIALIKSLSVLKNAVVADGGALQVEATNALTSKIIKLVKRTTGQAIMRGLLEVLCACIFKSSTPPTELEDCIRVLCHVGSDEASSNRPLTNQILKVMLGSSVKSEVFKMLVNNIVADSTHSLGWKRNVLCIFADTILGVNPIEEQVDVASGRIRTLCLSLKVGMGAVDAFSLVEPLTNIAIACCRSIPREDFETLLATIKDAAKLDGSAQSATTAVDLRVAQTLIELFLKCFTRHGPAAVIIFGMLISIATMTESVTVRLAVMKFLVRLRCDSDYSIRIINDPDTQNLAATLCRTKATAMNIPTSTSPSSQQSNASYTPIKGKESTRKSLTPSRTRSRSRTRPRNVRDSFRNASQPLWMYEQARRGLPVDPPDYASTCVFARGPKSQRHEQSLLDLELWLQIMVDVLKTGNDWEVFSYVLVHLPSQLGNCSLFQGSVRQISELHDLLNEQLSDSSFPEAPSDSGIRKGDIALCLYNALAMLLAYQDSVGVRQWKRVVSTFRSGIEKWDRAGKFCMHALAVCCYEIPNIILSHLNVLIEMMQKRITQSDLAVDILEFLSGLARIPEAYDRSDFALHQRIFSICIRYLQHSREQRKDQFGASTETTAPSNRASISAGDAFRESQQGNIDKAQGNLHEYIFTTAYQVMIIWFLAIDVRDRARHVAWITQELAWRTETGKEEMEPQSLVFLDMMHRTTFSNLGETHSAPQFGSPSRRVHRRTWLVGLSIITAEFLVNDGTRRVDCGQFTKRQASGTTHAVYYHNTEDTPSHQAPDSISATNSDGDPFDLYPNHMLLQLMSTISPVPAPLQPIPLPVDDDFTNRVLRIFDATDTVDGHKAAVVYIGHNQTQESEILTNTGGSEAFDAFVSKLGFKVDLQNAKFNTQGLDRTNGTDGSHTYAWRDRVTEIVFHIPTIMPEERNHDSSYARKKSHIGNDHVKIIFNDSGLPYDTNTFASDFNSINIVITPEAHSRSHESVEIPSKIRDEVPSDLEPSVTDKFGYYLVQTITSDLYSDYTPPTATAKPISAYGLPLFVRQLALNASVLCQVWRGDLGEYTSSWLFRLQQIMRLREKHATANASANVGYPQAADAGPSSHSEGETWSGTVAYGGLAEQEKFISSLDFTRWTK